MSSPVRGFVVGEATWPPGTAGPVRWEPQMVSPGLSEDDVRRVLGDASSGLPPASAAIRREGRPFRLALSPVGDHGLVCLRATAAAPETSGAVRLRLTCLVVDPDSVGRQLPRPAELWDAPLWTVTLGYPLPPLTPGPIDDAALTAFARTHPDQREVVFAAVGHALRDGGPLLVVGDDPAAAAHWACLVGRLLLPVSAWRLPFSTHERLVAPRPDGAVPFAVAGVPVVDAAAAEALATRDFTVLADDEQPVRGGRSRWALRSGPTVGVGPWARLAETVVVAGLLPDVAQRIDELAGESGRPATRRPLWALGAAVLLLDDVDDLGDLAADAADLVRVQWPAELAGDGPLLHRLTGRLAVHTRPVVDEAAVEGPTSRVEVLWQDVRTRVVPEAGESLARNLSRLSGAVRRGVEAARDRARERRGDDLPGSLLEVAALLDADAPAADRREVVDLASDVLVPALLDARTDPLRAGWEPIPGWLWEELVPELEGTPLFADGGRLPGLVFSPHVHRWLGSLSLPVGQLRVEALQRTGPLEWERAAHRVYVLRSATVSPLERAAAFLGTVSSTVANRGVPVERVAAQAADSTYPGDSLDAATASVLMAVLPAGLPFSWALAPVLQRTAPSATTRAAVARLREHEVVPIALANLVEHHERPAGR
ncbi:GAP1-M domain-containing protein [Geodermatophilus sp. SYSU D00684]